PRRRPSHPFAAAVRLLQTSSIAGTGRRTPRNPQGQNLMATPSRFLRTSGVHATIEPDSWHNNAFVLSIDGAEQSHVNLAAPQEVFYEYLRRIANAIDLVKPAGEPITALHL